MTKWVPLPREELLQLIEKGLRKMTPHERRVWDLIKIEPEKWDEARMGQEGGGFWAVALFGRQVLWYNDIEDGFNHSRFSQIGTIDEYLCDQWSLEECFRYSLFPPGRARR